MGPPDESAARTVDEVIAALQSAIGKGRELGSASLAGIGSGVDDAIRRMVDDRVSRALDRPGAPLTEGALTAALAAGGRSSLSRRVSSRGVARLARSARPLRALGGRSPAGLALRFGPALYDVVGEALRNIDTVATQLAARADAAGVDADPERLRTVVVQVLTGQPVDPDDEADDRALARTWLTRAGSHLAPFGLGRRSGRAAGDVAHAVQTVDPSLLSSDGGSRRGWRRRS